jgi:hypothetical protein
LVFGSNENKRIFFQNQLTFSIIKILICLLFLICVTTIFLQEPKDPLENLCKILDRLAKLDDENKCLKTRVDFLERQDALQRIIINSTFATKVGIFYET